VQTKWDLIAIIFYDTDRSNYAAHSIFGCHVCVHVCRLCGSKMSWNEILQSNSAMLMPR